MFYHNQKIMEPIDTEFYRSLWFDIDCLVSPPYAQVSNLVEYRENHRSALSRICRDEIPHASDSSRVFGKRKLGYGLVDSQFYGRKKEIKVAKIPILENFSQLWKT